MASNDPPMIKGIPAKINLIPRSLGAWRLSVSFTGPDRKMMVAASNCT